MAAAIAYPQFNDGPRTGPRSAPGHGEVPLAEILTALADTVPISVEWSEPAAPNQRTATSATDWAARTYASTQRFLDAYHASGAPA